MDNDFGLDIPDVIRTVNSADVFTFRFVVISQRLLIDMRTNELDGPMLKVVPRAASAAERFHSLKQLRPSFAVPDRITPLLWPRYMRSLQSCGVWDAVARRIAGAGFPRIAEETRAVLDELCLLERAEFCKAIVGDGYQTLWERSA